MSMLDDGVSQIGSLMTQEGIRRGVVGRRREGSSHVGTRRARTANADARGIVPRVFDDLTARRCTLMTDGWP